MSGKYTGLTGRPDRSAGIAGRLKKPTTTPPPLEPVTEEVGPGPASQEPVVVSTVTIDTQAYDWVHAQARRRGGINQTQVVLEAIEQAYEALSAKASKAPPPTIPARRLFAATSSAPRQSGRRRDGRPRRQLFLRLSGQDVQVLAALVDELRMGNRSNLAEQAIHEVMKQEQEGE